MVAVGFTIVCVVCCLAAPTSVNYDGTNVPPGLSLSGFEAWAGAHPDAVYCNFNYNGPNPAAGTSSSRRTRLRQGPAGNHAADADRRRSSSAGAIADRGAAIQNYQQYASIFLAPPISLMVGSGLWLLLEATIGFIVGSG